MKYLRKTLAIQLLVAVALLGQSMASAPPAWSQCCLGAEDMVAASSNGLYAVEATSLLGTGPFIHGPYQYRFRWTEVDSDGGIAESNSFDVTFETNSHFSMSIYVSDTGNGFLLDTILSPEAVFYAPNGTILQRHARPDPYTDFIDRPSDYDGCYAQLHDHREGRGPEAVLTDERDGYFLPAATIISETLDEQLLVQVAATVSPDLTLLGCLLTYPDPDVVTATSARLLSILPEDFDGTRSWITENTAHLLWQEQLQQFVLDITTQK